ncbi:hypothetical protein, partial [Streptomyces sp. TRM49041]|uniref:CurL C-terminal domain-containing protein n=1 Tax=Streptomyces sp. TRM49041 TaxID=2603216 RepID=UPI001656829B
EEPAEEAPVEEVRPAGAVPVVLSARNDVALRVQAERLRDRVAVDADVSVADIGFSAATSRALLDRRAVVVASDREELLARLGELTGGESGVG